MSTPVTVLLVMDNQQNLDMAAGCHLHSFERVHLQVVLTAPADQPFNLPSVCRLVTVLDEADDRCVVCKLQEFNTRVSKNLEPELSKNLNLRREKELALPFSVEGICFLGPVQHII